MRGIRSLSPAAVTRVVLAGTAVGFLTGMAAQAMRTRLPRSSPVSGGQIRQG